MSDEQIKRAVRIEQRSRAVRDANALRLVGAAVAVAGHGKPRKVLGFTKEYTVPKDAFERLLEAARAAGFKV